jgi:hypothetical protein
MLQFGSFLERKTVGVTKARFFGMYVKKFTCPNSTIDRGFNDFDNKAGS